MDDLLAARVTAAFGLGAPAAPPAYVARGAMGEIWRVPTSTGCWAVKALFEWDPPPPVPSDLAVQMAAADAGIRLPRPAVTSGGDAVVEVGGTFFRIYEWVNLADPVEVPVSVDRGREAGHILGMIHALPVPPDGEVDDWYVTAPEPERWSQLVTRSDDAAAAWAEELRARMDAIAELGQYVRGAQSGPARTCHRDFDTSNVLPDDGGRLVTLDWENAGPLDPAAEVAYSLLAWTVAGGKVDAPATAAFLDGYTRAAGRSPALHRGSFNVAVATYLNYLAAMIDQALVDSRHRSHAEREVAGLIGGADRLGRNIEALGAVLDLR